MASSKQLVVSLFLLGCFGCEYTAEAERPETRLMENMGACPEEDTVAAEERNGVDADRTAWRKIEQAPLCYYRAEETDVTRTSRCKTWTKRSLDEVRTRAAETYELKETGAPARTSGELSCTPEGLVFAVPADGPSCPEEGARWGRGDLDVGELIAIDVRQPARMCDYELTYEYTRRPFSCGGHGMFAP